ncbi:MAG: PVC-type heme-binding CxxCH protein, partial [Planctomycetota bacterium]
LEDTHETLNSFIFGPDGWLYGTHGVFTHSLVGAPGTPDEQRTKLDCGVWRFQPQRRQFEVFAWGTSNPWGVDFDDRGEAFLACCVIPHLWHMVQGGRFERQGGSHFDAHAWLEIETIADHKHYAGSTKDHAWWNGRERPVVDPGTDLAGGGHAHCGTLLYKGDAFPTEYRNAMLFFNIHGNRMNQDRLERSGSGYTGHHGQDLVLANDPWFRGVSVRLGPAGELFFIDWYDKNACHRTKPEVWDRTNGRMYRLSYGAPVASELALDKQSDDELAALQASTNAFLTDHARRLLQERGTIAASAVATLRTMLHEHKDPLARLRALWALHVVDRLDARELLATLKSPNEDLRAWAVRLALEQPARFPEMIEALPALARNESSPSVRLALAAALQRHPVAQRWPLAAALLAHGEDNGDHNIPTVLWYGVEPLADAGAERFVELAQAAAVTSVRTLMWRRAALGDDALRAELVKLLRADGVRRAEILKQMVAALEEQPVMNAPAEWSEVSPSLMASSDAAVREAAADVALAFGDAKLAPAFRARLANAKETNERRLAALEGLVRLRDPDTGPLLLELLDAPELRRAALNGLGAYDLPSAAARILAVLPRLEPTDREVALSTLSARTASARELLASIVAGTTSARLLDAASLRRQLQALGDPEVETLLQKAWGRSVQPSASAEVEIVHYKQVLAPEFLADADKSHGRSIFMRTCQACHKLYGEGGTLAPELTGSNRSSLDFLLANIIDPSAEMGREYQLVTVRLQDGRQLSGNIVKENDTAVTLKTLAGTQTLPRRDLAADTDKRPAIEYSKVSLMPPGQLQMLSDSDTRDLIGYLMDTQQAPPEASILNVDTFFDGHSLAGWHADPAVWKVEDGELIGSSTLGLPHNDFARADLVFADFRLEVEVKLTPDTANSGLQFRSVPIENGEMRGYQADVGLGWWGLLYEEQGRGVLQKPAANPVRAGEWNTYEILATGDRVQLAINGVRTVDITDPDGKKRGQFAMQVHSGGPTEVRFRNFRIELDPEPVLRSVH